MENEWIVVRDGAAQTFRFGHWIYSARELIQMLIDAGFTTVDCFGNFQGASYGPEATRMVLVARRETSSRTA